MIRGYCTLAVADTSSDVDAIGLDLVERLCLQGTHIAQRCKKVRLGAGSVLHVIGKVSVRTPYHDAGTLAFLVWAYHVHIPLLPGRRKDPNASTTLASFELNF